MYYPDKVKSLFTSVSLPAKYTNNVGTFSESTFNKLQDAIRMAPFILRFRLSRLNYRNMTHRYTTVSVYAISDKCELIKYSIDIRQPEIVHLDYVRSFPKDCHWFYLCRPVSEDHITLNEVELYQKMIRMYPDINKFEFFRIFLDAEYYLPYRFGASNIKLEYEISDTIKKFPMNDPIKFYTEISKYMTCESYDVDRDGTRTDSAVFGVTPIYRNMYDFLNPDTYKEICSCENPIVWGHTNEEGYDLHPDNYGVIGKEYSCE